MAGTTGVQYQHFVPQFLVRNFSHPYRPQNKTSKRSKRSKSKMFPGEPVVHNIDLSVDPATICETPVKRILGQIDMYRDTSKPSPEQQHIEQMFSRMEGQASAVFRKITKAFEQNETGLWLTRDERDLIRKFLFLLKYRGERFHQRFHHENAESYDADDRELLHDYMTEMGYTRPLDVWFHNLKTIMELRMDPEGEWIHDLPKRMFTCDAMWFITHAQCMYMAICTPSGPSDEFILTDNSYNIFEGPNCFVTNGKTGRIEGSNYTPLHEFAPISPKLMIILRSYIFPVAEEDANAEVKEERDFFRSMCLDMVYEKEVKSLLADLPIKKARNNYSEILRGRLQLINGEDGKKRKDHKFYFTFFPIGIEHINIINAILLDNAYTCSSVVFKSLDNLSRTLEWYLTAPCTIGKIVTRENADVQLIYLKKLAAVSRFLGSEKKPLWIEETVPTVQNYEQYRLGKIEQKRLFNNIIKNDQGSLHDTEYMKIYKGLDGSAESLHEDIDQATRMWKLRVKIDVWSKGLDESLRQYNRQLLTQAYLQLPPCRVWFFSKQTRYAFSKHAAVLEEMNEPHDQADLYVRRPEDIIAEGKCMLYIVHAIYINSEAAFHIIKPEKLAHLIYNTAMNDIKMKKQPELANWADLDTSKQIMALMRLALSGPSTFPSKIYIRDCGVDEIEQLAQKQHLEILSNDLHNKAFRNPMIEDSEKIELLTRIMVRSRFIDALKPKLDQCLLKVLKKVFFEILYPTPTQKT